MIVNHYEAIVIVGHVGAIVTFVGGYLRLNYKMAKLLLEINNRLKDLKYEHDLLMRLWEKTTGEKLEELPTRHHGGPLDFDDA